MKSGSPGASLYISDSRKGRIWRIMYKGDKTKFGDEQLAGMEKRKMSAHIRTPDEIADNLQKDMVVGGEKVYRTYCVACHLYDGKGDGNRFPPLEGSEYVTGSSKSLIGILLNGMQKPITIKDKQYDGLMPSHSFLSDKDLALVLSYVRQNFNNNSGEITEEEVAKERKKPIQTK